MALGLIHLDLFTYSFHWQDGPIVQEPSALGIGFQGGVGVQVEPQPARKPATCLCGLESKGKNDKTRRDLRVR